MVYPSSSQLTCNQPLNETGLGGKTLRVERFEQIGFGILYQMSREYWSCRC